MIERIDAANLVALHLLLEERSVTRAAGRLGISQSSMSHRLARLREQLGDPLLVREGSLLVPTRRAAAIAPRLADALRALEESVTAGAAFDPATARLALRVVLPDLLAAAAPRVVDALTREAPGVDVHLAPVDAGLASALAADTPTIALAPRRFVPGTTMSRSLGELRFGVVLRRGHPLLRRALDVKRWLAHEHVVVRVGNEAPNPIDAELGRRGLARRVGLTVPSFLCGLLVVARTDLVINAPIPLVEEAADTLGLAIRELPIPVPAVPFVMSWHPRFDRDPAHRWARARLHAALRPVFGRAR